MREALDPDLAAVRDKAAASGLPPLVSLAPSVARERVTQGGAFCSSGPELASVTDVPFPSSGSSCAARVYRPTAKASGRTLVYYHGGGWVTGGLDYSDELCRFLARDADCTVVSIDYRLAPEHPYPTPVEDAYAGLRWAAATFATSGILAVGGDSAGGNLAAVCARRARDEGGPGLAFQLLIYPVLDHDFDRPSYRSAAFPLGAEDMRWFWNHYVPRPDMRDDPDASPLRAGTLSGLPRAHLVLAGNDPLHDEGAAYSEALRAAAVPVTVDEYPSLCHGFLRFSGLCAAARGAIPAITGATKALFAASPGEEAAVDAVVGTGDE